MAGEGPGTTRQSPRTREDERPDEEPGAETESGGAEAEERRATGAELLRASSDGARLDPEQEEDALAYALATKESQAEYVEGTLRLNVGTEEAPKHVRWRIRSLPPEQVTAIRKQAAGSKRERRMDPMGVDVDEAKAALNMVVAGTLEPDLNKLREVYGLARPHDAVRRFFQHKGLLILTISRNILDLSGQGDDDVEVIGTKNS